MCGTHVDAVVWSLSRRDSQAVRVPTTGNTLLLLGLAYGQCWICRGALMEEMLSRAVGVVSGQLL